MIRKKDLLERIDYLDTMMQEQECVIELLYKRLKQCGLLNLIECLIKTDVG